MIMIAMNHKDLYRKFSSAESSMPIFLKDWWLDAACGQDNWDAVCVAKGGKVVAGMPYMLKRKLGFKIFSQPPLTQALGPWFIPLKGSHFAVLNEQKKLMFQLIDALPYFDAFIQNWNYRISNWLPFYWRGFSQTTRYTYIVNLSEDFSPLANFTSKMRNKIKKASKMVAVGEDEDIETFWVLNKKTFARQGLHIPYSYDLVKRIDDALKERDRRRIFTAYDVEGNAHSSLYLIWDNKSAYVHMVGEDPGLRKSGAGIFLIKHAMEFSVQQGLSTFDFEGSMIENIEIVRRSCGGIQTPYFRVSKVQSRILKLARSLGKTAI